VIDLFKWGNPIEIERRRRIRLSLWAYAYEIENTSLVDDAQFDVEAQRSDPTINTGHLDDWWRKEFKPYTGQWIHRHPEIVLIEALYVRYKRVLM